MAKTAKYTEQLQWVGTKAQRDMIEAEAARREVSRADVVRGAVEEHFAYLVESGAMGDVRPLSA